MNPGVRSKALWLTSMLLSGITGTVAAVETGSDAPVEKVDNFVLLDHNGSAYELYYHGDTPAIVITAHSNRCETQVPDPGNKDVSQIMINSEDSRSEIVSATGSSHPAILHDSAQIIGKSLGLTTAGESLVVDPRNWTVAYRGPAVSPALRRTVASLAAGSAPTTHIEPVAGDCNIDYGESAIASYADDIAPILRDNCMTCHREGGIGPWAMSEYRMIQGFAPMMREVLRVRRMPPWHADPAIGQWQHSAAISDEDTRTLIDWLEAGAPRGDGDDPLLAQEAPSTAWPLGEPDLVLELPAYDVPATGVVDYQFPVVVNPLDRDVWVVAATIQPGDSKVVHHVLMGSAEQMPAEKDRESVFQNYIMGYAPGNESAFMPKGTGVFVPVGGVYLFQTHYTPTGIASQDTTRVALYFADEPPDNFLRQQVVLNPRIRIPANTEAHEESAYFEFWEDATIYSLVPHSHYRGKSSTFELVYPDGDRELILSVPNYDFNWQRTYSFEQPKVVPKGTRIVHRTVYDNSTKNAGNPDPDRDVRWGLQSFNEMLYGSVSFSWNKERATAPIHDNLTSDVAQMIGFMDRDMDGRLSKEELPRRMRESLGWWRWWLVDTDFNGGLDLTEMTGLIARMRKS
jgi:hypothetical protein